MFVCVWHFLLAARFRFVYVRVHFLILQFVFFYLEVHFLFICVYFFICKVSLVSHRTFVPIPTIITVSQFRASTEDTKFGNCTNFDGVW